MFDDSEFGFTKKFGNTFVGGLIGRAGLGYFRPVNLYGSFSISFLFLFMGFKDSNKKMIVFRGLKSLFLIRDRVKCLCSFGYFSEKLTFFFTHFFTDLEYIFYPEEALLIWVLFIINFGGQGCKKIELKTNQIFFQIFEVSDYFAY